jgi:hypothetical protein
MPIDWVAITVCFAEGRGGAAHSQEPFANKQLVPFLSILRLSLEQDGYLHQDTIGNTTTSRKSYQ